MKKKKDMAMEKQFYPIETHTKAIINMVNDMVREPTNSKMVVDTSASMSRTKNMVKELFSIWMAQNMKALG